MFLFQVLFQKCEQERRKPKKWGKNKNVKSLLKSHFSSLKINI